MSLAPPRAARAIWSMAVRTFRAGSASQDIWIRATGNAGERAIGLVQRKATGGARISESTIASDQRVEGKIKLRRVMERVSIFFE